ncbi:pentapeptide repeat-containing protein [Microbacterium sp. TNHR37B]|uniref:pentapeptide repeat-containing protein n=1 Tax=Microbacterium sp. TNHR37B TaxID=1775956 RepID=UPI0007B22494|nr:pentapeptide repeat-containing protein [Microbacterium sp. TNHR37B]KZE90998.1 hypothetical protein AVP41_00527 [Microbacterium sp. TNHR37B]
MAARSSVPTPPRRVVPDLPSVLDPADAIERHADIAGARITGLTGDVDAAHARIVECAWEESTLARLDVRGAVLTDVVWREPRITELIARDSRWRDVQVIGGRLGALDLVRAELAGVVLQGVRIDYLSMASATLTDLRLVDCRIGTLDLPEAQLQRVAFEACVADEVDCRGMRASDADLRGLEALAFTDYTALRGVALGVEQTRTHAPALAATLGIRVLD